MDTDGKERISFTPRQAAVISNAIWFIALCSILLISAGILQLALNLLQRYQGVLFPPLLAIILAKTVQPLFDRVRNSLCRPLLKLRQPRIRKILQVCANAVAIVCALAVVLGPIILFATFFGKMLIEQVLDLLRRLPDLLNSLWMWLKSVLDDARRNESANYLIAQIDPRNIVPPHLLASGIASGAQSIYDGVSNVIGAIGSWLMVPVYMTLFLASRPVEGNDMVKFTVGLGAKTRKNLVFLIDSFVGTVVSFFRGQVLVAIIEGGLFALGFEFLAAIPYGLTLGLLVGFVNIIPYMGAVFVMPIVCTVAFLSGGGSSLALVLAVWIGVGIADLYITPKIVGNRTGLGPFAVIFSILFWGEVIGGFIGVFLAVPLTAFLISLLKFVRREYFPSETESGGMEPQN